MAERIETIYAGGLLLFLKDKIKFVFKSEIILLMKMRLHGLMVINYFNVML